MSSFRDIKDAVTDALTKPDAHGRTRITVSTELDSPECPPQMTLAVGGWTVSLVLDRAEANRGKAGGYRVDATYAVTKVNTEG